ncbi:hypothetical protein MLD38_036785 [Melastoma candidum]|uniref:Uncharacterized protein n=1 Tax=Melastoma candidum TaxID=119954 RepID=A0ACB9LKP7_9MYRT|nr:hypothetical protein MLD38_036785 [Melastoma candidum]
MSEFCSNTTASTPAQKIGKATRRHGAASKARVYADVNVVHPSHFASPVPRLIATRPCTPAAATIRCCMVAAPKREKDLKKRVVVTGTSLVSVFGNDVDAYYEKLLSGDIDGKNDKALDDCLRFYLVTGKKALEDADLGGDRINKFGRKWECCVAREFPRFHLCKLWNFLSA